MEKFRNTNTGIDRFVKNNEEATLARFGHINAIVDVVTALQNVPPGSGIASVQAGTDISVDNTDPLNPIVNSTVVYSSGSFTPVISNEVACTVTGLRGVYSQVNNVVTMSLYLDVLLDTVTSGGIFNVDLPVASTFANPRDLFGIASVITNPVTTLSQYVISADTSNNKCYIEVSGDGVTTSISAFVANIQYLVL
jgi:hypothetical protein